MGGALTAAMAEPQTAFNQQTALRLSCNSFVQPQLRNWIVTQVLCPCVWKMFIDLTFNCALLTRGVLDC